MKTTANYGLQKPDSNDFYNIIDFNLNADITDTRIYEKATRPPSATAGNLASLTKDGHLQDSGKKPGDFLLKGTKPVDIGADAAGAAARVQENLGQHLNDSNRHFSVAEKKKLSLAYTTADIVVSNTQPTIAEGRIWIKIP